MGSKANWQFNDPCFCVLPRESLAKALNSDKRAISSGSPKPKPREHSDGSIPSPGLEPAD